MKILASLGCSAALPEEMVDKFPPSASFHFLKISFLAINNCISYKYPFFPYGSYFNPNFTAQKNNFFLIPLKFSPLAIILSYNFSNSLGTAVMNSGFISFRFSEIVSNDSAKYILVPL